MSNLARNKFWKSKSFHVPGSLKPVHGTQSLDDGTKECCENGFRVDREDVSELSSEKFPIELSLEQVRITALEVIKNHKIKLEQEKVALLSSEDKDKPKPESTSNSTLVPNKRANGRTSFPFGPGRGVRSVTNSLSFKDREMFLESESARCEKLQKIMNSDSLTPQELQELCWSGIPQPCRGTAWKLLSSYLPLIPDRRQMTLDRKRKEYFNLVSRYYETRHDAIHYETYHQISIDIPRMSPLIPLFQQKIVQEIFERILYIWAIRHPASGYVQGINDLVTPFFVVFLSEHLEKGAEISNYPIASLPEEALREVEADSFWCFSKLLDGIQDNYTFAHPGIQKQINMLKELMSRINNNLHQHLISHNVEYLQFAFRWMNNLLMRELSLTCIVRLWDTYLSEPDGFASFHLYVCAALLNKFSQELLQEKDFQGLMLYLKSLPTENWSSDDIKFLLADGYRLKFAFADAPRHLTDQS